MVGSISFFVNAGVRFITEVAKMRAFVDLWDEIAEKRYGVKDPALRRFRYGVQVNSLGLTEQQPENNVYRILLSMLAVTLSKKARARAVQLPAWNEALGLPRPWDQQWSLRLQQIVAYETDLLDYGDIFDGSVEIDRKVEELKSQARAELAKLQAKGGAVAAIDYMKEALIASNAARVEAIEKGEQVLVGVNAYTETEESPLSASGIEGIQTVPESVEIGQIAALQAWRQQRDDKAVRQALVDLKAAAAEGRNIMPPSIEAAKAGVTTGEWGQVLREVFGEYRAPTGIHAKHTIDEARLEEVRQLVKQVSGKLGRTLTFVVGKPGLDGHSNGAEQIAVRATDVGMDVVYDGIRLTPAEIVEQAKQAQAHVVGLSILSGSHVSLVREVVQRLREAGLGDVPVVVGGIIPPDDVNILKQCGASAVYTPKDFQLNDIMTGIVELVDAKAEALVQVNVPVPPLRAREKVRAVSRLACAIAVAAVALAGAASPGFAADQPPCPQGSIASGSDSVMVEGKQAARAGDATGCGSTVVEGSADVFINGKPAAVQGDATGCGGSIVTGSSSVFINGKPMAASGDAAPCPGK